MDVEQVKNRIALMDSVVLVKPSLDGSGFDLKTYLENVEVELINAALVKSCGVVAVAAKLLGIRRTTLIEKMKRYQIHKNKCVSE